MTSDCKWIREQLEMKSSGGGLPELQQKELQHHLTECSACARFSLSLAAEDRLLGEVHRSVDDEEVDFQELADRLNRKLDALEGRRTDGFWARVAPWSVLALGFSILAGLLNLAGFDGSRVVEQVARDLCSPHRATVLVGSLTSGIVVCAVLSWLISRAVFRLAIK